MASLQGHGLIKSLLDPVSVTSDGVAGSYVDYNGYNRALVIFQGGLVATGDSDDTVTLTISKSAVAAATAAASDEVIITAAAQTLGASASTTAALGIEFLDIDFVAHGLTGGSLTVDAVASEGCAAACSASIILYNPTGTHTDTAMTIGVPASS